MQMPNMASISAGTSLYARFSEAGPEPARADIARPVAAGVPGGGGGSAMTGPVRTPDGDVLDLDWNRVGRFMQRYQWRTEPPVIVKNFDRNTTGSKPAVPFFSMDGDRVELNFGNRAENRYVVYGKDDIDKAAPVEPKGGCETCASRRYVDKSDDSSVSYQTPTKLNPQTAAAAVAAHEREHVFNERAKADREDREIVSQTVTIKYAVCPECNTMYPSGGTTRTQSVESGCENEGAPEEAAAAVEA